MTNTLSPADRMSAARIRMLDRMPFYGLLAMRLTMTPDPQATDVWSDGKTLGYSPEWATKASFDDLMSGIAHVSSHLALLHHLRRGGRDDTRWQKACDVPVFGMLQESSFALPNGVIVDPTEARKSAEEIYSGYPEPPPKAPKGSGDGEGDDNSNAKSGSGEVRDQPGNSGSAMDESELEQAASDALKDLAAIAQQARQSGAGLPGCIEAALKSLLYPQQDWETLLREYMKNLSKADYSWSRPNRRFIGSGLYLPSLHSETDMGTVVVAVDTSISIDERKLSLFGGALNELLEDLNPEKVIVIYCDTRIHRVDEANRDEYPIDFHAVGRGCTSLCPPFEYVEDHGIEPDVLLYFTDLGGYSPKDEPPYPVIWLDQDGDPSSMKSWNHTWGMHVGMKA